MTTRRSRRAFCVVSQRFHLEALSLLHGARLDVRLVCCRPRMLNDGRALFPGAVVYDSVEARAGHWAEGPARAFGGVPGRTLEELALFETAAKNMIDRWNWTGASAMAVHRLYLRYVEIWDAYLREHRPEVVVFHGEPHRGFDWVLYGLCRARGIPTGIVTFTLLDERITLRPSIEDMPGPAPADPGAMPTAGPSGNGDGTGKAAFEVSAPSSYYVRETIPKERDTEVLRQGLPLYRTLLSRAAVSKALGVFRPYPSTFPNVVPDSPVSNLERKVENARLRRLMRRSLRIYESSARPPDLDRPYVYYPIHFQPEATTIPLAGTMYDELNNLRLVSSSLPEEWQVVTKEHPQMLRYSKEWPRARGTVFYEELRAIPRVDVAPVEFASAELARHARLVGTATGSAGWEALLAGKFVLAFGYPWYGRCPGVSLVRSAEHCVEAIEAAAGRGFRNDPELVQAFVDELTAHHTFRGAWEDGAAEHSCTDRGELLASTAEGIGRWVEAVLADPVNSPG